VQRDALAAEEDLHRAVSIGVQRGPTIGAQKGV